MAADGRPFTSFDEAWSHFLGRSDHCLHLAVVPAALAGEVAALAPFDVELGPVTCFHAAVVAEARGPLERLLAGAKVERATFLPHVTLACVREPHAPHALREELKELRPAPLGSLHVEQVQLVRVPAARTTVLEPWEVLETVPLSG